MHTHTHTHTHTQTLDMKSSVFWKTKVGGELDTLLCEGCEILPHQNPTSSLVSWTRGKKGPTLRAVSKSWTCVSTIAAGILAFFWAQLLTLSLEDSQTVSNFTDLSHTTLDGAFLFFFVCLSPSLFRGLMLFVPYTKLPLSLFLFPSLWS